MLRRGAVAIDLKLSCLKSSLEKLGAIQSAYGGFLWKTFFSKDFFPIFSFISVGVHAVELPAKG